MPNVVVIGGGAAGFFSAINIAERCPAATVTILEKSNQLLGKVKVSGGGRCNVTNARFEPSELVDFYPRGHKKLRGVWKAFTTTDMVSWLESRGVPTHTEPDMRMFPVTNSSQTVIDCFLRESKRLGIRILKKHPVEKLAFEDPIWTLDTVDKQLKADVVIMATGSSASGWSMLDQLGVKLEAPVPSLFTFNIEDSRLKDLAGVSFSNARVRVAGQKLEASGPLLITHWGLSGPAVLKLSAWGARWMHETNYRWELLVNFVDKHPDRMREEITAYCQAHPKRALSNYPLWNVPKRFWSRMTETASIRADQPCGDIGKRQINKLIEELAQGRYKVDGKSTFKEEFVTCGGVELHQVNLDTFKHEAYDNLYLAGEVLNIDALTGGFNFQACWSAGWLIAKDIQKRIGP